MARIVCAKFFPSDEPGKALQASRQHQCGKEITIKTESQEQDHIGFVSESGKLRWYHIPDLWHLTRNRPVEMVSLSELSPLLEEETRWFEGASPTIRDFAEAARRIYAADLAFPIILSAEGHLLDGRHRLAKALALGWKEIPAVRFSQDPKPYRECFPEELETTSSESGIIRGRNSCLEKEKEPHTPG